MLNSAAMFALPATSGSLESRIFAVTKKTALLRDQIEQVFSTITGLEILELGCGTGLMGPNLIESGAIYTGLDVSTVALEQARQHAPQASFVEGNLVDFRLDHRFDLVFLGDVLLHIVDDRNWELAMANVAKHVKGTGLALIKEEAGEVRSNPAPHVVLRNRREYSTMCSQLGFRFEASSSPGFFSFSTRISTFSAPRRGRLDALSLQESE